MLSAIYFNLDQSKILSSGKWLKGCENMDFGNILVKVENGCNHSILLLC